MYCFACAKKKWSDGRHSTNVLLFRRISRTPELLAFLWYRNNDPSQKLIQYRMKVHVFVNTPSLSVATYGLRKSVADLSNPEVKELVQRNFYVDDLLVSESQEEEAVRIIQRTQKALMDGGNIRLHNISSNSPKVVRAFDEEDRATELKCIDLEFDDVPLQKSLGMSWDLKSDSFKFVVAFEPKPFTKRGMLSMMNSIYDPIGFISPVVLKGKMMFRNVMTSSFDWDDPLPPDYEDEWRD